MKKHSNSSFGINIAQHVQLQMAFLSENITRQKLLRLVGKKIGMSKHRQWKIIYLLYMRNGKF